LLENGIRAGVDPTPRYAKDGESGLELRVLNTITVQPWQQAIIPHGFAMEIPYGYEGQIRPRSSSYGSKNVEVILGTIDANYRGEMKSSILYRPPVEGVAGSFVQKLMEAEEQYAQEKASSGAPSGAILMHVTRSLAMAVCMNLGLARMPVTPLTLSPGDRVSQLVIAPVVYAQIETVDELNETERGEKGFGESTGGYATAST
jgi:dUTP pyrophosphatase